MSTPEKKTYHGNCHCGAFKFSVKFPEIKTATACNCSICFKKNYLWSFPAEGDLIVERGEGTLTGYEFAGKTMAHRFCPDCGTGVMGFRHGAPAGKNIGINVRTLMGLDSLTLEIKSFDGLNKYQPQYVPPKYTGELPKFDGEGLKVYTGGCHCGAVTLAVKTKPLSEVDLKEDNCSICQRNGYVLCYPTIPQVAIAGAENTKSYEFGRKYVEHHFCKICGIPLYMKMNGPPKDIFDAWPEEKKENLRQFYALMPVNVRTLNNVEWDALKIQHPNSGAQGYSVE